MVERGETKELHEEQELDMNAKISKEIKAELLKASDQKNTIRFLIDQYYQSQEYRIRSENQTRSLMQGYDISTEDYPEYIKKILDNAKIQEATQKKYLDVATKDIPVCNWMRSIKGIGPVIAAYLYATFEVSEGKYATDFLSYAGLNDNNNPWLGNEKASNLVKEVLSLRNEYFSKTIIPPFKAWFAKNGGDLTTEYATFVEAITTEVGRLKWDSNVSFTVAYEQYRLSYDKIYSIFKKVTVENVIYKIEDDIEDLQGLDEYIITLGKSDYIGEWTYSQVAAKTRRKLSSIKKGVLGNKKKDTTKCDSTKANLISYLAKPPYNTNLKKTCYLIGQSFIKNQNRGSLYGQIYAERKREEIRRNENGEYAEQAARELAAKNYSKTSDAYKTLSEGKLTLAHINMRAQRYAVKLFISHVFEAMYYDKFHKDAPHPYVISHMGHHDYIGPEVDYRKFL